MKIYTVTFDAATMSPARIWVAPYSQFAVGVKVFVRGIEAEGAISLKKDGQAVPADASKVGGFTVFQAKSAGPGSDEYEVSVAGLQQKMTLVQVTTGSTVFDVGGAVSGGGDMSDYYTKGQTDQLLSAKADEDELTAYATTDSLTAFYEKSETSSAAEIGAALDGKQPAGDYALTSQIPTVNDGTLTITQGGVLKGTFTANQSTDVSVDLAAGGGGGSYSILTVQLEDGKYALQNHSVNNVTLLSGTTSALMEFPLSSAGAARDFFVRLNVEDATGLSVYWQEPDGSTPSFDATNDAWNEIQTGVNVMMFMETAQ